MFRGGKPASTRGILRSCSKKLAAYMLFLCFPFRQNLLNTTVHWGLAKVCGNLFWSVNKYRSGNLRTVRSGHTRSRSRFRSPGRRLVAGPTSWPNGSNLGVEAFDPPYFFAQPELLISPSLKNLLQELKSGGWDGVGKIAFFPEGVISGGDLQGRAKGWARVTGMRLGPGDVSLDLSAVPSAYRF